MSNALTISNSGLPANAPRTAIKKAAKKAAKKTASQHHPKKHVGSGHEHKGKHDVQADLRRAYLHLARAISLLEVLPKDNVLSELKKLYSLCKDLAEANGVSPKAAAESARALEHLCFVSFAASHPSSENLIPKNLQRDFDHHFHRDFEKQAKHLEEAEQTAGQQDGKRYLPTVALLDLARHSHATAGQMLRKEDWYLAHECLRGTDAIIKALDHLS
jgi:hypothetical protein